MKRNSMVMCALAVLLTIHAEAQNRGVAPMPLPSYPVEKVGDNLFRLGSIHVDTTKKEVSVPGTINTVNALEFIATKKNGFKSYESAIELDTNSVTFNIAMILIGLDKEHAVPATRHFDPNTPLGDAVEVTIEWKAGAETRRIPAAEILWDKEKKEKFSRAPAWVYTGGVFDSAGRYLPEQDGVIIGFVHDPASIIEWAGSNGLGRWGFVEIDPQLGLVPHTPVTVIVKATGPAKKH